MSDLVFLIEKAREKLDNIVKGDVKAGLEFQKARLDEIKGGFDYFLDAEQLPYFLSVYLTKHNVYASQNGNQVCNKHTL
jgi:hypothetical protein